MEDSTQEQGILYIVATPIGNLEDVTVRAIRILGEVSEVFCEDTRVTRRLFEKYSITTHLTSMNARTEATKLHLVLQALKEGKDVAYVSDAGTPGISDPGVRLVEAARAEGARIDAIPGPSALTAALSIAGVPTNQFVFLGFLPQKKGRRTALTSIAESTQTVVCYESTHRIIKLLKEFSTFLAPQQQIILARELTKIHEEILNGTAEELLQILEAYPLKQKGEFVVIVAR